MARRKTDADKPAAEQATYEIEIHPAKTGIRMPSVDELRQALNDQFGPVAQMIAQHEKLRTTLYEDRAADGSLRGLAIGVGRNLTVRGISQAEALLLFYNDLADWTQRIAEAVPAYEQLNGARQAVLLDMAHTLSVGGLRRFKNTLRALDEGDYLRAAYEIGDSRWYDQQPRSRSGLLLTMMLTGKMESEFGELEQMQRNHFAAADRRHYQAALDRGVGGAPVQIVPSLLPQKPRRQDDVPLQPDAGSSAVD